MIIIKTIKKSSIFCILLLICVFICGCVNKTSEEKILDVYAKETENKKDEPPKPVVHNAKLTFTGDIMVHSWQYNEAYNKETGEYDFNHNFTDMKKYFEKSDYVVGNFETVLGGEELGYSDYPMFNTPDSFAVALKAAGFDLLTTSNNHCMDKRMGGTLRTIQKLSELGFDQIGTYGSKEERDNIFIKNINGIDIAFLAYTYGTNGISVPEDYLVNIMDEDLIKSDILRAKALNPDFIVVLPHMGNEYETYTKDVFKSWTNVMLESGADMVIASHPHVLQPMEYREITDADGTVRKCFVMYSMGNFISSQTTPPRNASILLNVNLEKTDNEKAVIKEVSFIPIWTQFRGTNGRDYFVVRSVYEMLSLSENEMNELLRKKDVQRLKDIHLETTSLLLKQEIPMTEIRDEYIFEE